jgi:cytochrome c6
MKRPITLLLSALAFAASATVSVAATAAENWDNNCAKCHGADGKGQTKIGKKLNLKDYTDAAVQAKMTDEDMTKAITAGVFEKDKEKMKAFKDDLSAGEIKDLVGYVRKFKA